jgi:CRP-like cAMP-binding protein
MNQPQQTYKNRILAALPKAEINRLAPYLSSVTLKQHETLLDGKSTYGYFLEQGIASVVVTVGNRNTVEVGIIGIDGIVGLPILLGTEGSPGRTFIQIAGSGFRIKAKTLRREFERPCKLRQHLQRYMQAFFVQTAQTAACNRLHGIEERLARWLSACRDRTESDELLLTHDFLSQMLGAPRTTVTLAAGLLHRKGLIDYNRGVVIIRHREALGRTACECYRIVRNEFTRRTFFRSHGGHAVCGFSCSSRLSAVLHMRISGCAILNIQAIVTTLKCT